MDTDSHPKFADMNPKLHGRSSSKTRVPVGTFLGVLFSWMACPPSPRFHIGSAVAWRAHFAAWAGHIEKGRILCSKRPYAHTRNPLSRFPHGIIALAGLLGAAVCNILAEFYLPVRRKNRFAVGLRRKIRRIFIGSRFPGCRTSRCFSTFCNRELKTAVSQPCPGLVANRFSD
jgi:hypothetical protein